MGARGIYETEFLDAYRKVINETSSVIDENDVTTVNPGLGVAVKECQFGTEFRTSVLFDAHVSSDLTDEENEAILESLRQAIAEPFRITDKACNPEFRTIDTAEIGPNRSVDRRRTSAPSAMPSYNITNFR